MAFGSASGEPQFTRCTSDLWVRRLDAKDIWRSATFVGLDKEPLGGPPSTKVHVKTGGKSPVYGRYRRLDAGKPELVLMAGDVGRTGSALDRTVNFSAVTQWLGTGSRPVVEVVRP